VYSHGDWMEEWRFLTFGVPLLALSFAEARARPQPHRRRG
jgi:hypothetical protein